MKFIRIYTRHSVVDLCEEKSSKLLSANAVKKFVSLIRRKDLPTSHFRIFHNNLKLLKKSFFSQFTVVEAAGGVVFNEKGELLIIYRRGFYDLPKGKIDKGETKKQAAVREVMEETGLKKVKLKAPLEMLANGGNASYHTYRMSNKPMIKPSYWYIMKAKKQKLTPETSEDIEEALWVKPSKIEKYYKKMYPAIVEVIESALRQ